MADKRRAAIIKKIEAQFPRDKTKKGEVKIEFNGEALGLGRDAREHLDYILGRVKKLRSGTFRVVKVASAVGAARLVGLSDEDCDLVLDTNIWFVIPHSVKDPTQEFGPCYTVYFKATK